MVTEDSAEDPPRFIVLRSGSKIERVAEDPSEYPDNCWLPNGWTVEFNAIRSGKKSGRKIKSFVDPSTGRRFYSKPQVFRYFKNVKQRPKRKKTSTQSTSKVIIETYTVADLPGWTKELKITRNPYRRTRRDPFYTDPVSGYVFCSRKEVDRYLETGEISRHAFLPKERQIKDNTLEPPATTINQEVHQSMTIAKRLMLAHSGTKQKLNSEELADANEQCPNVKTVVDNGNESKENSIAKKGMCLSLQSSKRLAGPEPESVPSSPMIPIEKPTEKCLNKNMIEKISESKENSNEKKGTFLPFQSSKQVAGAEYVLVTVSESRVQAETDLLASSPVVPTEECLKHYVIDDGAESKENSDAKKTLCLPLRYSRRLTGIEPELVAASESSTQSERELAASSAVVSTKKYLKQNGSAESKENSNDMNEPCLPLQASKRLAGLRT